ncbi:MAG TPA: cyanophycin synthetase [Bacteroidales bacterium]|nr:cyanophycin synthetase [Bacteroidales bacterium]HPS18264.1 cyanophycin synthetase [Bacteroidales bacterium]
MKNTIEEYLDYSIEDGPLKVQNVLVMHGANYFSAGPIVKFRINLGEYNEVFTNLIPNFPGNLEKKLPSLIKHHCSVGQEGGFLLRVNEGTLLGHVIEHVSIELQIMAGMDVGYGKTRSTLEEGVYNIIFRYVDEVAGVYAGKAAVNLINSLLTGKEFNVQPIVDALIDIREKRLLGPSTQAIVNEAEIRKIPTLRLDAYNLVQLGTGKYHKRVRATITSDTNLIAVETADNKYLTNLMLSDAGIPVPETIRTDKTDDAVLFFERLQKPVVIKPCEGYLGKNLAVNLTNKNKIISAFQSAQQLDKNVLIQPFIEGKSYRLLVIGNKFIAASELTPPFIIGNGTTTIKKLIAEMNANPERQTGDKGKLSIVVLDEITENLIAEKGYNHETILPQGEQLFLKISGNMRLGGSAKDVTDIVHPFNIFLAERAAQVIGLNVAGVDFITKDISSPINENEGVIIEVNAAPDFRMHMNPTSGTPRNVASNLIDILFPEKAKTRVPVFSVTGTAGKTIMVTLLNYCLKREGYTIGMTTSDGLYIGEKCLMKGDMTYPEHVKLVLKDPTIDCAILETSREGILRKGLGYKFADFGIVLNMYDDHVGADDIKYVEDLAYAKSVVAEEVYETGYTILNADSSLVLEMRNRLFSKSILFSKYNDNKELLAHVLKGEMAVYISDGIIFISKNSITYPIAALHEIPLTFNEKARLTYDQILATVATLAAHGIANEKIKQYLCEFIPSFDTIPGRLNFIDVNNFKVLLDNAHNYDNFKGIKEFLSYFRENKIGVISAAGNRSDEEIMKLGILASETYNDLILYEDPDKRGREDGQISSLLKKGALQNNFPEDKIHISASPQEALLSGLNKGNENTIVVILSSTPFTTYKEIKNFSSMNK